MERLGCLIRVRALRDNPCPRRGRAMEPFEQPLCSREIAHQPEIVAQHKERVKPSQIGTDLRDREHACVFEPLASTHLDGQGRYVDTYWVPGSATVLDATRSHGQQRTMGHRPTRPPRRY